jgi:hypothetical protein
LATALLKPCPTWISWLALTPLTPARACAVLVAEPLELLREGAAELQLEAAVRDGVVFVVSKTLMPRASLARMYWMR